MPEHGRRAGVITHLTRRYEEGDRSPNRISDGIYLGVELPLSST